MDRPTRDQVLMRVAEVYAERSTCSRRHVGAVIALRGRVLTAGYNGAPAGMPHCDHVCNCGRSRQPLDENWPHDTRCSSIQPCLVAVHDVANAIAFAARYGVAVQGAEVHTTCSPCHNCAQLIINAGIVRVVYRDTYRDSSGLDLLFQAGVQVG